MNTAAGVGVGCECRGCKVLGAGDRGEGWGSWEALHGGGVSFIVTWKSGGGFVDLQAEQGGDDKSPVYLVLEVAIPELLELVP